MSLQLRVRRKRGGVEAIASSYVIVEADKSEYGRTAILNRAEIL
ncbi:MAG: hypothetical protein AAFY76_13810 [Cyanobacteria bacterium J06649_11]